MWSWHRNLAISLTSGFLVQINSPCVDADDSSAWNDHTGAIMSADSKQTVIYHKEIWDEEENRFQISFMECNGDGSGALSRYHKDFSNAHLDIGWDDKCFYYLNYYDGDFPSNLQEFFTPADEGGNPSNYVYTVFDKIPYIPSLPLSRVEGNECK